MKKFFKMGCFGFIGLIVLIIIIGVAAGGGEEETTNVKNESNPSTQKDDSKSAKSEKLTKEKFAKIKNGMTYEEVVKITGTKGTVMSETGEEGTDFHTVMYEFKTDGFMSNANMTFQGGKLINKTQIGLGEDTDVEITIDEFNKLKNGMSTQEVFKIVGGEGEITSETGDKGTDLHTIMYSYKGKGGLGANASLMFQGDKLQNKTQVGLE